MEPIFWADGPPSALPRHSVQVFSLPPGGRAFVRLLGGLVGVWLHWVQVRTVPCRGWSCLFCEQGLAQRWKGYAPALLWQRDSQRPEGGGGTWKPIVCEVTEAAAAALQGKDVRGLVVELRRPGRRQNGPLELTLLEQTVKDPLPDAFDVRPILERMWAVRSRVLPGGEAEKPDTIPFRRPGADDQSAAEG